MTNMRYVIKRTGKLVPFQKEKISNAVSMAMSNVDLKDQRTCDSIADIVEIKLFKDNGENYRPSVDEIHDLVENELMDLSLNDVAKAYILYRDSHKPNIFKRRVHLKPYEYPELNNYVDAIRHAYWVHTEFNFTSDIQDFKVNLNEREKSAVKRAMLAISQIEVAVKSFWGDIYKKMPKPEMGNVGATFAESEVRHADAYSHLLKILGLDSEFETLMRIPAMRRRIKYLDRCVVNARSVEDRDYFESIILFSMFVENVSLFSQFLVIMSFNKHKNTLKGVSNAVEATSKEENIHAEFGFDLVNLIKKENPEWWTDELKEDIVDATLDSYDAESEIVDWMFEKGDLEFLTREQTMEFIRDRYNRSLKEIGIDPIFNTNPEILKTVEWFDDEILATKHTDFFNKRSINYTKRQQAVTEDDLF